MAAPLGVSWLTEHGLQVTEQGLEQALWPHLESHVVLGTPPRDWGFFQPWAGGGQAAQAPWGPSAGGPGF